MSFHSGSGSVSGGLTRNYYLRRLTRNVPQAFDLETTDSYSLRHFS